MTRRMSPLAALALTAALSAAGCGKLGPLEQPPPLFGDKAKADYQQKKEAEAAEKAQKAESRKTGNRSSATADQPDDIDNRPRTTRDIQDPNQRLTPLSSTPVDGSPNPMGAPVSVRPPN